nr:ciliogenesis and planar polarity effector 2 isoform X1 [Anolis sagrei ordinatus]
MGSALAKQPCAVSLQAAVGNVLAMGNVLAEWPWATSLQTVVGNVLAVGNILADGRGQRSCRAVVGNVVADSRGQRPCRQPIFSQQKQLAVFRVAPDTQKKPRICFCFILFSQAAFPCNVYILQHCPILLQSTRRCLSRKGAMPYSLPFIALWSQGGSTSGEWGGVSLKGQCQQNIGKGSSHDCGPWVCGGPRLAPDPGGQGVPGDPPAPQTAPGLWDPDVHCFLAREAAREWSSPLFPLLLLGLWGGRPQEVRPHLAVLLGEGRRRAAPLLLHRPLFLRGPPATGLPGGGTGNTGLRKGPTQDGGRHQFAHSDVTEADLSALGHSWGLPVLRVKSLAGRRAGLSDVAPLLNGLAEHLWRQDQADAGLLPPNTA